MSLPKIVDGSENARKIDKDIKNKWKYDWMSKIDSNNDFCLNTPSSEPLYVHIDTPPQL